jgi:hypothetical protein
MEKGALKISHTEENTTKLLLLLLLPSSAFFYNTSASSTASPLRSLPSSSFFSSVLPFFTLHCFFTLPLQSSLFSLRF